MKSIIAFAALLSVACASPLYGPSYVSTPIYRTYSAPLITKSYAAPIIAAPAPIITKSYAAPIIAAPIVKSYAAPALISAPVLTKSYVAAPALSYGLLGGYGGYRYSKW